MALGAGAEGGVEGEAARLELGHVEAAIGAGHRRGKQLLVAVVERDEDQAVGQLQGLADGLLETLFGRRLVRLGEVLGVVVPTLVHDEAVDEDWGTLRFQEHAVDDGFDGVVLAAVEQRGARKGRASRRRRGAKPLLIKLIQQILKLTLAASHDGRHDGDALALAQFQDALHNLLGGLAGDGPAAVGAVGRAHRGIKQAQIVVDFGDGADGGAGAAAGGLLLDGDGRAEPLDRVHVGPLDLVEELARVGGERLDVAALALGIDGVEGERALAGAGKPGDHGERIAGNAHVDVAQVVLARATHRDVRDGHVWLNVNGGFRVICDAKYQRH